MNKKVLVMTTVILSHIIFIGLFFSTVVSGNDVEIQYTRYPSITGDFPEYTYESLNNIYIATIDEHLFTMHRTVPRDFDEDVSGNFKGLMEIHVYQATIIYEFKGEMHSTVHKISIPDLIDIEVGDTYLIGRSDRYYFHHYNDQFHDFENDTEILFKHDIEHLVDYDITKPYDQQNETILDIIMPYARLKEQNQPQS